MRRINSALWPFGIVQTNRVKNYTWYMSAVFLLIMSHVIYRKQSQTLSTLDVAGNDGAGYNHSTNKVTPRFQL